MDVLYRHIVSPIEKGALTLILAMLGTFKAVSRKPRSHYITDIPAPLVPRHILSRSGVLCTSCTPFSCILFIHSSWFFFLSLPSVPFLLSLLLGWSLISGFKQSSCLRLSKIWHYMNRLTWPLLQNPSQNSFFKSFLILF